jgi:sec-independent protein translocase protein TatB
VTLPGWLPCGYRRLAVFDLSITKILVLLVIGLVIFGPDQLPKMAKQLGGTLRDLRRVADKAKADLTEGLGPEFSEFDLKHLMDDLDIDKFMDEPVRSSPHPMDSGQRPPFDPEAT